MCGQRKRSGKPLDLQSAININLNCLFLPAIKSEKIKRKASSLDLLRAPCFLRPTMLSLLLACVAVRDFVAAWLTAVRCWFCTIHNVVASVAVACVASSWCMTCRCSIYCVALAFCDPPRCCCCCRCCFCLCGISARDSCCSSDMFKSAMQTMNVDVKKMPLGQLSVAQVRTA